LIHEHLRVEPPALIGLRPILGHEVGDIISEVIVRNQPVSCGESHYRSGADCDNPAMPLGKTRSHCKSNITIGAAHRHSDLACGLPEQNNLERDPFDRHRFYAHLRHQPCHW
jgi:hypothetical protein